ncbi:MAG: hypothetical protein UMV23_04150, partial [Halanaerobium sp.]|nr:hypothetical protein [Halanaerobium sp.]
MYKAGIDIGTNSLRLLIAKVNKEGRILEAPIRMVRTARLGEGIIAGQLLPAAVERALQILADFAREIAAFSPIEVNVVSTSVLRSVSNPELLLDPVRDQLGWQIQ